MTGAELIASMVELPRRRAESGSDMIAVKDGQRPVTGRDLLESRMSHNEK